MICLLMTGSWIHVKWIRHVCCRFCSWFIRLYRELHQSKNLQRHVSLFKGFSVSFWMTSMAAWYQIFRPRLCIRLIMQRAHLWIRNYKHACHAIPEVPNKLTSENISKESCCKEADTQESFETSFLWGTTWVGYDTENPENSAGSIHLRHWFSSCLLK